jgi:hypothetical protein
MLPDPEVLLKYGKLAGSVLCALREKAKSKGKEHREWFDQNIWRF